MTIQLLKTPFHKKLMVLRSNLTGARYFEALRALEYALARHTGVRKDGVTPEFDHQVSIALYALTLPDLQYREAVIATIMLHDTREDKGISDQEIRGIFIESEFAEMVANAVAAMTKKFRGIVRDPAEVFAAIAADPVASIGKGCDRIHNQQTMVGVFSTEKQKSYMASTIQEFLPMLKAAKRSFPHQSLAYENIKHMLVSQIELLEALHEAKSSKSQKA